MADSEQRTAAAAPPEAQNVGAILKQARVARDLSLEQVSTELRIEVRQLDALEQDRFERIGVPVFVKGYLRQYATLLGLDVRDLLALYHKQTSLQEIQIQPSKTIKLHDERQITAWVVAAVILAVLVVAFAVWWWNGGGFRVGRVAPATQTNTEPPAAPPVAAAPVQAPAAVPAAVRGSAAGLPASAAAEVPVAAVPETRAAATAGPPASGSAAGPSTAAVPVVADADNERLAGGAGGEPSVTAVLAITFDQESWAEISDARGERLFYGLGAAGRDAKLSGAPPFAVVLGNAPGVRIKVDDEDFPVPTNGKPGAYSRFSVDVAGD